MSDLTQEQIKTLEQRLRLRRSELREAIRQELLRYDEEPYIELAGRVHDDGEQSLADLLVDLNLARIDRELNELREIEAALLRISMGSYGVCVDCGGPIGYQRLQAYPTAERCLEDQQRHEQRFAQVPHPRL